MCSSGGFLGQRLCCIYAFVFPQPRLFLWGLPRWLSVKESVCQAGDECSVPGLRRSPGDRNGNPLQYSCLGNPMKREAWWATVQGVTEELDIT